MFMWVQVSTEDREGIRYPRSGVNQQLWAAQPGCWEINSGPLEEKEAS